MPSTREKLHASLRKLRDVYRAGVKRGRYKAEIAEYNARLGLRVDVRDFEKARKQTDCDVEEYFGFEFYKKDEAERDAYLTRVRRTKLIRKMGDVDEGLTIPGNKVLFNMIFGAFLQREWINPSACTAEEFIAFVKKHGRVMVKPSDSCSGKGIHIFAYEDDEKARACYDELVGTGALAEELLKQHPQMDRLNPHCINTVRFCTYTDRDAVHILLAAPRSARGAHFVDNVAAGGIIMAADLATGIITSDGVDEMARFYPNHPLTGVRLKGFQIPNWDKALALVRRAARRLYAVPQCRYLGWDVGFLSEERVAIIECNWRQGLLAQVPQGRGYYHELKALCSKL